MGPITPDLGEGAPWWAYLVMAGLTLTGVLVPTLRSLRHRGKDDEDDETPPPRHELAGPPAGGPATMVAAGAGATDAEIALIRDLVQGLQSDKRRLEHALERAQETERELRGEVRHYRIRIEQLDAVVAQLSLGRGWVVPPPPMPPAHGPP